jgi:5'-3' exonuclease
MLSSYRLGDLVLLSLGENEMNKITFIEGKALKPFVQLLCVLPQQSNYLLPTKLKNLMSNPNKY